MSEKPEKVVRKNITIRKDQNEWLKRHHELNLSGLVQNLIDTIREEWKKVWKD